MMAFGRGGSACLAGSGAGRLRAFEEMKENIKERKRGLEENSIIREEVEA